MPQFLECVHLRQTQNQLNMALLQVNILKEFNTDTYIKFEVTKTAKSHQNVVNKVAFIYLGPLFIFHFDFTVAGVL